MYPGLSSGAQTGCSWASKLAAVPSRSPVWLFAPAWTAARQTFLSFTLSLRLLRLRSRVRSIQSVRNMWKWTSVFKHSACGVSLRQPEDTNICTKVFPRTCPCGASCEEPACPCRRQRRSRWDPRVGKSPWGRAWQPTPVFLPGEPHGRRSLEGYSPEGRQELDTAEMT